MILLWIITFFYAGLILFLVFGFNKIEVTEKTAPAEGNTFSVVVPFRNEAENLPLLLRSFSALKYPPEKLEFLLVNDASEDDSLDICRSFIEEQPELDILLLSAERKTPSPKKDAINTAVAVAKHDFIVTTDADCQVPAGWLTEMDIFITQTTAKLVAGPVSVTSPGTQKRTFLDTFQEIDFLSLQGATIGGFGVDQPFMCNGANLCYEKASFKEVNGFQGNESIASGDDIFLLEKFLTTGLKVGFLKSRTAVVVTTPVSDFQSLIAQRIRWAAKTSGYEGGFGKMVAVVVFLMNVSLVIGLLAVWSGHFPQRNFLLAFLVKFNIDFYLIYKSAVFFGRDRLMKHYFWCSFIYPFFSSFVAVASLFGGYNWKGRRFKK